MTPPADTSPKPVRRRRVFHIPGYDPHPPRRYRELYRREGAAQAEIAGHALAVEGLPGEAPFGWKVQARIEGQVCEARISVLDWRDLVRESMTGGPLFTYGRMLRVTWLYLSTGTLRRLAGLRKGPILAALYPVALLLLQLAIAVLAGWGAGRLLLALAGSGWAVTLAAWLLGFGLGYSLLVWFERQDARLYAYYLMNDYALTASRRGAWPPALSARLSAFATLIDEALSEDWDEVLVVGHSSGAQIAVSALAEVLRGRGASTGPALSLLTLGQSIPVMSFLPDATRLRADLAALSADDRLTWIDVSAPGDGCAFALCDPVAVTGVAPEAKRWPLVLSAAFSQRLSPERYAQLRRRYFRLHFQYLCAFDDPGPYDYFAITAGPITLAERFAGRRASASRITEARSRYRATA